MSFRLKLCMKSLNNFLENNVWTFVPRPKNTNIIGTKWIFKNKSDEFGNNIRNRARLVAQGYTQVEGIDFDETLTPIARLESVRLLLAITCHIGTKWIFKNKSDEFSNIIRIELGWSPKDTHKLRVLILMKLLLQLLD